MRDGEMDGVEFGIVRIHILAIASPLLSRRSDRLGCYAMVG